MEPTWQKARSEIFKKIVVRDYRGRVFVVDIADYDEYIDSRPDSVPKEAEIKVKDTDELKVMLTNNASLRGTVAEVVAAQKDITVEQANNLILEVASAKPSYKKVGLVQRLLNLFKR